jgi:2-dehydro-3-deoxygalactonokinase
MSETRLIALDWGTSSLRAYRIGRDTLPLERVSRPLGILNVSGGDFAAVFEEVAGPWRAEGVPALACGMIGSRQGWAEAPYVAPPAGVRALAEGLSPVQAPGPGGPLLIVPGVALSPGDGPPDVMRGEETQLVGAGGDGLVLLPGTHSKWAWLRDGEVVWFATFMTGELFASLRDHSILGRLMAVEAPPDEAAFRQGLETAAGMGAATGGLLRHLFSVRTLGLFDRLAADALPSYFSGLLIGAEIVEAVGCVAARFGERPTRLRLIGEDRLADRYRVALDRAGIAVDLLGEQATVRGLVRVATAAGLLDMPDRTGDGGAGDGDGDGDGDGGGRGGGDDDDDGGEDGNR